MCGIAGLVDHRLSRSELLLTLRAMTDAIWHRGPDDQGASAVDGCGIAMRRLSIIDLSGGHQPIGNETGQIHVVCNGEIYNYVELRDDLKSRGHVFQTGSDTEVVVHLYEEYGDACLQHLRGMFGLAILDTRREVRLLLARDRLGKKPLFFATVGERFSFGSEMKSLLAASPELREPDYRTLGEYLQFGYIHQPRTIYRHIQRLPAAHYAVFEGGQLRLQPYWDLNFCPNETLSDEEWREQLDATLAESVRIRLRSDVPLGVFLSGGLDSSAVVAYASEAGLKPLQTFTIGFDRSEWDESSDAERVARYFGTQHHVLRLDEATMRDSLDDTLHKMVAHCDEPFGDSSALPMYHVSRLARQHVTVVLSGDGGDEMFAGYSIYRGMQFARAYRRWLPTWLGRHVLPGAVEAVARWVPGSGGYRGMHWAKILRDSALPLVQAYRDKASIFHVNEIQSLLTEVAANQADYLGVQFLPEPMWSRLQAEGDLVGRLTEIDLRSYLLDDILVKVDRMSMAHSLEVRSPLLDQRVAELAARMPSRLKIRGNTGKHVLREVLRHRLPPRSLRKGKQGFSVPLRDWFRGKLAAWVQDYLGPGGHLPESLFAPQAVQALLREHQQGIRDHARKIWLLLVFAAWHRQYQSGPFSTVNSGSAVATLPMVGGTTCES